MEINITSLADTGMFEFSHSQAEGGENAGPNTWNAALNVPRPLLSTPEELSAMRAWCKSSGGDFKEDSMSENELNALFLQLVAGDIRECPALLDGVAFEERTPGEWFYEKEDEPDLEWGPFETRSAAYANECPNPRIRPECLTEIDWKEYQFQAERGRISGNLYASDGEFFYSLDA